MSQFIRMSPDSASLVALADQRGELVAVAEHVGDRDVQSGMRRGVPRGLLGHPVRQHAGEQEVPGHHDPPGAQSRRHRSSPSVTSGRARETNAVSASG